MQPGNPSGAGLGAFTLPLHPPGSRGYRNAKKYYDQLDKNIRLEWYLSRNGASIGGAPAFAGPIRDMPSDFGGNGDIFELTGVSDLFWANYSMPFLGELLSNDVTSNIVQSYLGTNEPGAMDTFNPFTSGNYTSTSIPGHTAGSWTGTTDDGLSVVSISTGSGAGLISNVGAGANDRWHNQFAECKGRLVPSSDPTNAGSVGIGLSQSNANLNNCVLGYFQAALQNGRYALHATIVVISGGVQTGIQQFLSVLSNVDDAQGIIPFEISLLISKGGNATGANNATITINGKTVIGQFPTGGFDPGTATWYPFLFYGTPGTGSATAYLTNLVQATRFTADGPSTASAFTPGSITAATHSLGYGTDPGPSFLDLWSRCATREGWYWRYTPQAFTGSGGPPAAPRTLGTVDFGPDPGNDLHQSIIFSRGNGNLVHLGLRGNSDPFMSGTATASVPSVDGAGISTWRDIGTMTKYGMFEDQGQAYSAPNANTLRRYAASILANKIAIGVGGSKLARVLRDPSTADKYRELDRVQVDDPMQNVIKLTARILSRTFYEGSIYEDLVFDQFHAGG